MISNFTARFKESAVSIVPVMLIVLLLHFTIAPLNPGQLPQFLAGGVLLILGLTIFLAGADIGMVPFGQRVGSALARKRSLALVIAASFIIGFAVTIAEPDVQVLAGQVNNVAPGISRVQLLVMIALGVGAFMTIGAARIVLRLPLSWLLIVFYLLLFGLCAFVDSRFIGVAFDAGGATTGPITVPFIMAMGLGVAAVAKTDNESDSGFGMVGLASIGPIAAVAVMGVASGVDIGAAGGGELEQKTVSLAYFIEVLPHVAEEISLALAPIILIFAVFQIFLMQMPGTSVKRIIMGFVYTWIGLVIFMTAVNGGFAYAGQTLGVALGSLEQVWILIPIGLILGAVVVVAEPAVWVLTEQVEGASGGYIARKAMLAALSISIAAAVAIGMFRVVGQVSIWYVILPGYALALLLTRFCPPMFTAIAFDSGGVASGPMSATFVLSLTLGASYAVGGNPLTDAFGMIAMIAMAPLITIQILGLIFRFMEYKRDKREKAKAAEGADER
ncbi:MAG: DUF1538 domain-containing protein [Desulfovibrionaceae bacterium]|nr:DUF1538 domain-containing protein [Desulfovibrionaceae bacterium]